MSLGQCFSLIFPCVSVQADPRRHRTDVGLQLRGGQRGGEGAALLLRVHRVQRKTAVKLLLQRCNGFLSFLFFNLKGFVFVFVWFF